MQDITKKVKKQGFYIHPDKTVEFFVENQTSLIVDQDTIGLIHNHLKTMTAELKNVKPFPSSSERDDGDYDDAKQNGFLDN